MAQRKKGRVGNDEAEIIDWIQTELARRAAPAAVDRADLTIGGLIERCSGGRFEAPVHLGPYIRALEAAARGEGKGERLTFHAPPQHGKSESAKHAFLLADLVRPGLKHCYATYNAERAREVRDSVAQLAAELGLEPRTSGSLLTLKSGTQIKFVGRGGGLTGYAIEGVLIIDDILKDYAEACSATIRETCWTWFTTVAMTRLRPGASVVVMNTRWSTDDLIGRLIEAKKWPYIRIAAECDSTDDPLGRELGEPLWPRLKDGTPFRDAAFLEEHKANPREWASMFQGRPRPKGDALFHDPKFYDVSALPTKGYRVGYGVDLAYTAKTRADWSVCLKGYITAEGLWLVGAEPMRAQMQADKFTARMAAHWALEPGPMRFYGSTTEVGLASLIREKINLFQARRATVDKYVRALPTAEKLWNVGKVFVPNKPGWQGFARRITEFSGEDGGCDDECDSLAALGDLAIEMMGTRNGASDLNAAIRGKWGSPLRLVAD